MLGDFAVIGSFSATDQDGMKTEIFVESTVTEVSKRRKMVPVRKYLRYRTAGGDSVSQEEPGVFVIHPVSVRVESQDALAQRPANRALRSDSE